MVLLPPTRQIPAAIRYELLDLSETIASGDSAYSWAQAQGRLQIYFYELSAALSAAAAEFVEVSLMRLPRTSVDTYNGAYQDKSMLRRWSNIRSTIEYPFVSEYPDALTFEDGEALVFRISNDTGAPMTVTAELALYYTGQLFRPLQDA